MYANPTFTSFNQIKHQVAHFYANNDVLEIESNIIAQGFERKRLNASKKVPNLTTEEMKFVIQNTFKNTRLTKKQRKSLKHIPGIKTDYKHNVLFCIAIFISQMYCYAFFVFFLFFVCCIENNEAI